MFVGGDSTDIVEIDALGDMAERRRLRIDGPYSGATFSGAVGLTEGERAFHLSLQSSRLGLTGRVDLAIATPSRTAANAEAVVVEYKLTEQKAGTHFKLQLAAYALLIEEVWGLPVKRGFLYSISLRKAEPIPITPHLRQKVVQTVAHIKDIVEGEVMPPPPTSLGRCVTCEFRRFCNDVV